MERPDRAVPVHHRVGRRRVHSRVARARLQRACGEADLSAGAAHRPRISAGGAAAAADASRASRTIVRNDVHPTHHVRDGDVRVRLFVVPDGRAGRGDLARVPPGTGPYRPRERRAEAAVLPCHHIGFRQHQPRLAPHRRSGGPHRHHHRHSFSVPAARLRRASSSGRSRPTHGGRPR